MPDDTTPHNDPGGDDRSSSSSSANTPAPKRKSKSATATKTKPRRRRKSKPLPPFNVVLLNDDDHSYEYVIDMLRVLFGHSEQAGYKLAQEVDTGGRAIVYTTHKELAELKRDQIHSFGADQFVAS